MRPTRGLRARVWTSALILVGTLGVTEAAAAPADEGPPAAPGLLAAMQRDFGLTEDQAVERLADEAAAAEAQPAATRAAGDAFAGSWFDPAAGELVVAVAGEGAADQAADAVRDAGAEPLVVEHTAAELDAVVAELDKTDAPAGVVGWHTDQRANGVVVEVVRGATEEPAVAAFLEEARAEGPVTVRAVADEAPAPFAAGTVGGDPYYTGNVRCSIGFSVHGGFVTAGHCGNPGAEVFGWDRSRLGTFEGSSWPGNDYGWVSVGHGWWTEPVVIGWGTVSDTLVRGSNEAPVGASVCRSGSTTGWHCGTVLGKNETVNYVGGEVVHGLTRTSVCAEGGDSGGSYLAGDQAQGVTSGGWGNCSGGDSETWHQPVNEILSAYGLTLHTA